MSDSLFSHSCYLNSVMQVMFSLPEFKQRSVLEGYSQQRSGNKPHVVSMATLKCTGSLCIAGTMTQHRECSRMRLPILPMILSVKCE